MTRNSFHIVVVILFCLLACTACFQLLSKRQICHIQMSVNEEITKLEMELLGRINSWNPFDKLSLQELREKNFILERQEERKRSEEDRKRSEEDRKRSEEVWKRSEEVWKRSEEERKRSEETKVITIVSPDIYDQLPQSMTRKIFEAYYLHSDKVLMMIDEELPSKYRRVRSFDELVDQEVYYLEYFNS